MHDDNIKITTVLVKFESQNTDRAKAPLANSNRSHKLPVILNKMRVYWKIYCISTS